MPAAPDISRVIRSHSTTTRSRRIRGFPIVLGCCDRRPPVTTSLVQLSACSRRRVFIAAESICSTATVTFALLPIPSTRRYGEHPPRAREKKSLSSDFGAGHHPGQCAGPGWWEAGAGDLSQASPLSQSDLGGSGVCGAGRLTKTNLAHRVARYNKHCRGPKPRTRRRFQSTKLLATAWPLKDQ